MKNGYALIVVFCAVMTAGLGGCGIKPGHLSPPSGTNAPTYPQTYPKP